MADQDIPTLVRSLALKVNMTPIAWRIDRDSVTIVFEQGPKITFDREDKIVPPKPIIQTLEKPKVFTKAIASVDPPKRMSRK